jgi:hypothetical protein
MWRRFGHHIFILAADYFVVVFGVFFFAGFCFLRGFLGGMGYSFLVKVISE